EIAGAEGVAVAHQVSADVADTHLDVAVRTIELTDVRLHDQTALHAWTPRRRLRRDGEGGDHAAGVGNIGAAGELVARDGPRTGGRRIGHGPELLQCRVPGQDEILAERIVLVDEDITGVLDASGAAGRTCVAGLPSREGDLQLLM